MKRNDPPTGTIHGRVVDDLGEALAGAQIILVGTNRVAVTEDDGRYTATRISPGDVWIQAITICHAPDSIQVRLEPGASKEVNFGLMWSPPEVDGDCCLDRDWFKTAAREGRVCL
jgi:hypothetical protein